MPEGERALAAGCRYEYRGLLDVREKLGGALLGRRTVDEEMRLDVALVAELERCSRLGGQDATHWKNDALGRLAHVGRHLAVEDHEDLFLDGILVPSPAGSR